MHEQRSYSTLKLNINDRVSFTRAEIDRRYASDFGDLLPENGPYHGYSVVDFPDSDRFSPWSRIGVRKGVHPNSFPSCSKGIPCQAYFRAYGAQEGKGPKRVDARSIGKAMSLRDGHDDVRRVS
ncbi:hypothetical protein [Ktedonospora formicarum]|nr:hypothetical protein [Ktedonospora formicarum]